MDRLEEEEKQAVDALLKLNLAWPKTLKVHAFHSCLAIFKTSGEVLSLEVQVASMPNNMGHVTILDPK